MEIKKVNDKLDFDVEVQWNCNSARHCVFYTNKPFVEVVNGPAIYVCQKGTKIPKYSTSGWSIL